MSAGAGWAFEEAGRGVYFAPEQLTQEDRLLAAAVEDFMRGEVAPLADRIEARETGLMERLLQQAGELGFLGLEIPEEFGGLGLRKTTACRLAEAIAVEPSFAVSHNVHTSVATLPLVLFGTDPQKQAWLPKLSSGECIGAYALTEAHSGSDALASRTRAEEVPSGYSITGEKMWITNAAFAGLFVVFAKAAGERFTALLVPKETEGVSIGPEERKIGLKGSSTCRVTFERAIIPGDAVLGEVGSGTRVALYTLNLGRLRIAASSLGQAKNLIGIAARYSKERMAFGRPIADYGLIREKLGRMALAVCSAESAIYATAGSVDRFAEGHGPIAAAGEFAVECTIAKIAATEALDLCADEALQMHGGYGYSEDYPVARAWRDARINRIYEGTNEINRLNIAHLFLKRERVPADPVTASLAEAARNEPVERQLAKGRLAGQLIQEYICHTLHSRLSMDGRAAALCRLAAIGDPVTPSDEAILEASDLVLQADGYPR